MRFALALGLTLTAVLAVEPAPKTSLKPVTDTLHGVSLSDPYRWLEDQNSPETRAWINDQIAYTDKFLATLPGRDAIRKKLEPMFRIDVMTTPDVESGRYFFMRRLANENRMSICVREGLGGKTEVLVRPDDVSKDESVSVGLGQVSDDGKLMLYSVRQGGEDEVRTAFLRCGQTSVVGRPVGTRAVLWICATARRQGYLLLEALEGWPDAARHQDFLSPSRHARIAGQICVFERHRIGASGFRWAVRRWAVPGAVFEFRYLVAD